MSSLEDVQKYLEYQLRTTPKYNIGWGGKEELNLFWSGIHNSKTIVDAALLDPERFHELVKQIS